MRRFELVEGSSSKFWEVAADGPAYTVRYGRIGTDGQSQTKELADTAAASAAVDKLVKEKTKKGYVEVGEGEVAPAARSLAPSQPAAAVPAQPVTPDTSNVSSSAPTPAPALVGVAPADSPEDDMPLALRRLAIASMRNPEGDHDAPSTPCDSVVVERGLLGAIDELVNLRVDARAVARAVARADAREREEARAYAEPRFAEHEAQWSMTPNTSPNVCGALTIAFFSDDQARVERIFKRGLELAPYHRHQVVQLIPFVRDATLWDRALKSLTDWEIERGIDPASTLVYQSASGLALLERAYRKGSTAFRERVIAAVLLLQSDEAASFILDHGDERVASEALASLVASEPARVCRAALVMAARTTRPTLALDVLAMLVRKEPKLAELATTDSQRAIVSVLVSSNEAASAGTVVPILATPPWHGRKTAQPIVVAGLVAPDEAVRVVWPTGLREKLLASPTGWGHMATEQLASSALRSFWNSSAPTPEAIVQKLRSTHQWALDYGAELLPFVPEPFRQAIWESVHPTAWHMNDKSAKALVAALEERALEGMLVRAGVMDAPVKDWIGEPRRAAALPQTLEALFPIASARIAIVAALGFGHRRARKAAQAWVLAHPATAAQGLIPLAVGKPGKDRAGAEEGLRLLASQGHEVQVLSAARAHGQACVEAVEAVLAADLLALPKAPKVPSWIDVTTLAPLVSVDGARQPADASVVLLGMLAASAADAAYPAIEAVKESIQGASLDAFAWSLFRAWYFAGAPSKDGWAFTAMGHLGGALCVSRLAPLVAVWPNDGLAARAQTGVEILGSIGTDTALVALHRFSQKAKTKGLKSAAQERMDSIAEARGLTPDELADRLVPDLGLDDNGTLALDLGDRGLTVGFDEVLVPYLREPDGSRSSTFPKAGKTTDKAKHKEAKARFAQLQKDAKEVSKHVIARLENAMANGRGWPAEVAEACFFMHPLMRHVAARVAWIARRDDGTELGSFRVAEDGSLATPADEAFALPSDATVFLLHPAVASAQDVAALGQSFSDYEILQPFPQLARPVLRLAAGERGTVLQRWNGRKVATRRMFSLESRGWTRTVIGRSSKVVGEGSATLSYSPGIDGSPDSWQSDEQTLGEVTVDGTSLEALDPVVLSELLFDVERLFDS